MTDNRPRARVFWSGRSQAVRLPKAFRLSVDEVSVRREGAALVLEPIEIERDANGWPEAFWQLGGAAPGFSTGPRPARHERADALQATVSGRSAEPGRRKVRKR